MRRIGKIIILTTIVGSSWATGSAAYAAPAVTVNPNSNLHSGETVAVSASGFTGPASLFVYECTPNPQSFSDCSGNTQDFVDVDASGSGTNPTYPVRTLSGGQTDVIVCDDTHPCVIQVSQDATDFSQPRASAPISFAAAAPPPDVPETRFAALLPVGGLLLFAGAVVVLGRRRGTSAS